MTWEGLPERSGELGRKDRRKIGRAHRAEVPLDAHAALPSERGDPIEILRNQDATRLERLVPIRHGRMSMTPFTFYRGAAAVMAADLATLPTTALGAQLCGDAHLANFGLFNGPDRNVLFDVNDFDETLPGPFEWDVKRLAASVTVAARDNDLSNKQARKATVAAVAGYRELMADLARVDPLTLHYFRLEFETIVENMAAGGADQRRAEKLRVKARRKNSLRAFDRLTEDVDGQRRIVHDPPLLTRLDSTEVGRAEIESLRTFFGEYLASLPPARRRVVERYRAVDLAHKIVGVGSVGTRCLIIYLSTGDGEPLFLQFKEATASVLEPHLGSSDFEQAGERVVQGQRLMQAAGDVFLGWARHHHSAGGTTDFYFRQLWDGKSSLDVGDMGAKRLRRYGELCGRTLALAHARSGDAAMISGYLGDDETFDHAVAHFARGYADLTDHDHAAHVHAIGSGRIEAVRDL